MPPKKKATTTKIIKTATKRKAVDESVVDENVVSDGNLIGKKAKGVAAKVPVKKSKSRASINVFCPIRCIELFEEYQEPEEDTEQEAQLRQLQQICNCFKKSTGLSAWHTHLFKCDNSKRGKEYAPQIGPEGIETLCNDLNITTQSLEILVLAFYLETSKMGFISLYEFAMGMRKINVDTLPKLEKLIFGRGRVLRQDMIINSDEIENTSTNGTNDDDQSEEMTWFVWDVISDEKQFKELYKWVFMFAKPAEVRGLDAQYATVFLRMLSKSPFLKTHVTKFCEFVEYKELKVFTRDQWLSYLEFERTVQKKFEGWDEGGAWPTLIDEFVEWSNGNE
ncbi:hypothetical protein HK098_006572 [Nowakowskiella sp. JEL0407]|nr:hypothetical protein HK098_006572 [Nowakowskiella sp. JEL0407]